MKIVLVKLVLFLSFFVQAQNSATIKLADTSNLLQKIPSSFLGEHVSLTSQQKKKRVMAVSAISVATYGSSLLALNQAWYKNYTKTSFHTYNDFGEWLQMDKVGHAWSVYQLSRASTAAWQWAGLNEKNSVIAGGVSGFAYLTVIEILDAHSEKWGWSWGDVGANITGSSLFALQQIAWKEQRVQFKFSTHKLNYSPDLKTRADDLFGKSLPERLLKDYNGQTYWMSVNLHSFSKGKNIPAWLNLAIGYGADGMFGGYENFGFDKDGNPIFSRPDIKRKRQWYLSPDVDVTKIKTRSKILKTLLAGVNCIKIPAPTLQFSNGSFSAHWLYF